MKNTLDILHVTFDKSPADETVISVARVVNGKIYVLKMELGEQADILYRLLTEKTAKVEIKAESKEQDTISRQEVLKYFEGWKNQIKYYHPYAKNFDIPYEEAIQRIKDVPPVKCVSLENKYIKEIDHLRKYISKLETQIVEQEPKSEWQQDHEILKAYSDGANDVLGKIRAEIETKYGHCNLCEYGSEYDRVYTDIGDIADILQIIDKYMAERSEKK